MGPGVSLPTPTGPRQHAEPSLSQQLVPLATLDKCVTFLMKKIFGELRQYENRSNNVSLPHLLIGNVCFLSCFVFICPHPRRPSLRASSPFPGRWPLLGLLFPSPNTLDSQLFTVPLASQVLVPYLPPPIRKKLLPPSLLVSSPV